MELLALARALWRRRLLVALGAVAALALGVAFAGTPTSRIVTARTSLLLDTRESQLVGAAPVGAESLAWRTQLLADQATSAALTARIAVAAKLPARQLRVMEPLLQTPEAATALPRHALKAAALTPEPFLVLLQFDQVLPVIAVTVTGPDRAAVTRVADATAEVLEAEDQPVSTALLQGFDVTRSAVRVEEKMNHGPPVKAMLATVVLVGLWCALIVALPDKILTRRSRRTQPA